MKKRIVSLVALAAVLAVCLCTPMLTGAEEGKHEHVFNNGICECGKYEVAFSSRIPIKDKLTKDIEEKGTLETLTYTTHVYSLEEAKGEEVTVEKNLQVYLPYGYDPAQQYNIFYLTHGAGESEYYWLNDEPVYEGTKAMGKTTKAVIDNCLKQGITDPIIFVSVTSITKAPEGEETQFVDNNDFAKELRNDIVPFVESRYSTYAGGDVSEAGLIASRDHRAFAGFSMGGAVTAAQVMMPNLDMFSWFGTYSAAFGAEVFPYTPADFQAALESFGKDYPVNYWFNGDGTADFVRDAHWNFNQEVLANMPDWFQDGANYAWIEFKGGSHAYNCWIVDLYDSLLVFFK
ncbi:MAG: hypothetical protein HUJ76_00930 [Parasporobacterium sp.]|nr:hypothetical protein [Parasporobacterium sp.]